jgi:hypothetical protein
LIYTQLYRADEAAFPLSALVVIEEDPVRAGTARCLALV